MQYDKVEMEKTADNLEAYLELLDKYIIIDGITVDEYNDAVNMVKKLIKKLRKGKGDAVFDEERYRAYRKIRDGYEN